MLETTTGVDTMSEDDPGAEDTEGNAGLVRYISRVELTATYDELRFTRLLEEIDAEYMFLSFKVSYSTFWSLNWEKIYHFARLWRENLS